MVQGEVYGAGGYAGIDLKFQTLDAGDKASDNGRAGAGSGGGYPGRGRGGYSLLPRIHEQMATGQGGSQRDESNPKKQSGMPVVSDLRHRRLRTSTLRKKQLHH